MADLVATDVSFSFGSKEVLRSISLRASAGTLTGLVGPNGSGKTTLLRCLAGLLESSGEILYGEFSLRTLSLRRRAAIRAHVPQSIAAAFPHRACDVAAMGLAFQNRFYGAPPIDARVHAALEEVAFDPPMEQRFDRLSGGERQQILVARALLQGAEVLLLDEPTSALDLKHRAAVVAALKRRIAQGAAAIVSLHDLNLASLACDRLLLLDQGRIVAEGTPEDVLTRERIEEVYGVPVHCGRHPAADVPLIEIDPKSWQ